MTRRCGLDQWPPGERGSLKNGDPREAVVAKGLRIRAARVRKAAGRLAMGRARTVSHFAEGESTSSPTVRELERAVRDGGRPRPVTILSHDSSLVPELTISLNPGRHIQRTF